VKWVMKAPSVHIRRFLVVTPFLGAPPFQKTSRLSGFLRNSRNLFRILNSLFSVSKTGLRTMNSQHCETQNSNRSGISLECTYMLHSRISTSQNSDSQKEANSNQPMDTIVLKQDYVPVIGRSPMIVSKLFPSFVIIIKAFDEQSGSDIIIGISRKTLTCLERNQITSYGGESGNLLIYSRGSWKDA